VGETAAITAVALATLEGEALAARTITTRGSTTTNAIVREAASITTVALTTLEGEALTRARRGGTKATITAGRGSTTVRETAGVTTGALTTLVGIAHARSRATEITTRAEIATRSITTGGVVREAAAITTVALTTLEGVARGTTTRGTTVTTSRSGAVVREAATITTGAFTCDWQEISSVDAITICRRNKYMTYRVGKHNKHQPFLIQKPVPKRKPKNPHQQRNLEREVNS
jgi:hypothetical protein